MRDFDEWCRWPDKGVPGEFNYEEDKCELETGSDITREEFERDWTEHLSEGWNGESVDVEFWQYEPETISQQLEMDKVLDQSDIDVGELGREDVEDAIVGSYIACMKMYGVNHKSGCAHAVSIQDSPGHIYGLSHYESVDEYLDDISYDEEEREMYKRVVDWSHMFAIDSEGDVHTIGVGDIEEANELYGEKDTLGVVAVGGETMTIIDEDGNIPELSGDINISNTGLSGRGF